MSSALLSQYQTTHRAPVNPMDKHTVVSILPKRIVANKPTIIPNLFILEPGSAKAPSVLVVGSSSWWRYISDEQPPLEIPTGSLQLASAIVTDYLNGLDGCDMSDKMPGLFYIPGELDSTMILAMHKPKIDAAVVKQNNWYKELIRRADVMWARTNGNPLSISNDARMAAEALGEKTKPWMQDFTMLQNVNCPACGSIRNNQFPICANCKTIIDADAYKKLGLTQIKQG